MAVRRVFISWAHSLFYESVRLLLNHPDVEIVGSGPETEIVWAEIADLRPDMIIIEKDSEAPERIVCAETLQIWASDSWNSHIVHVGLQDNTVQVYRREQHTLEQSEDLLHLVLEDWA